MAERLRHRSAKPITAVRIRSRPQKPLIQCVKGFLLKLSTLFLKIISFYGILNSKDFLAVVKNELDSYLIKLGLAIRKIRLSKGMTQLDLSSDSGIPLSQIGAIENGKLNTTIKTLIKITSTLEVKLKDIIEF